MRCKFCGADVRAVTYNSDGYSERLVVLDDFNKINEDSPSSTGEESPKTSIVAVAGIYPPLT